MPVLKTTKNFYDYEVTDALTYNLKSWLDYGLLETGAYKNAVFNNINTSGFTTLQKTTDDRYQQNQVYEFFGPSLVWEKDVSPVVPVDLPVICSGVWVNHQFYNTTLTSGTYSHYIDWRTGRLVFNSPTLGTENIQAEYCFRDVGVYSSDSNEWREIVQQYALKYDVMNDYTPSGMAETLKEKRIWLPAVIINIESRSTVPLQLGGGEMIDIDLSWAIFSDKAFSTRKLCDLISNQYDNSIDLFDVNTLQFPYNYDGSLVSGALTYPQLANRDSPYFWTYCRISHTNGQLMSSADDIFKAKVSQVLEVQRYNSSY